MGDFDKKDFKHLEERNGFEIGQHPHNNRFYVFLPQYESLFVEDFLDIVNARNFCDDEDAGKWADEILKAI